MFAAKTGAVLAVVLALALVTSAATVPSVRGSGTRASTGSSPA
jgi:hypothetical protein